MPWNRYPPNDLTGNGINNRQTAFVRHVQLPGRSVVSHIVGITADVDGPARLHRGRVDQLERSGVAVRDSDGVEVGNGRHALGLVKTGQRSEVLVFRGIENFDRVIAERGDEQVLARGIERQVIDASRHVGQPNRRQRIECRRRLGVAHSSNAGVDHHQERRGRECARHHDFPIVSKLKPLLTF